MKDNHKLALYIAYYLAKYDKIALSNLGYKTWNIAFEDVSSKLKININSVKNWRDEFDPLFEHRAGWHQRPMSISRVTIAQALENLSELQVREIVRDILSENIYKNDEELRSLLNIINNDDHQERRDFVIRATTGKAAENFFIDHYARINTPIAGKLIDVRDFGVGYDFKIQVSEAEFYIEVKGISDENGGILLTDKEWEIAHEKRENYFLCIISNLENEPIVTFIQNPAVELKPKKYIYTSIQVNWIISRKELNLSIN
mgnify:CR=1 FL=1